MLDDSFALDGPASALAKAFLSRVLSFARERSVDQSTLARRAGISPEALSRLKKSGRCRLETALALAQAAGFGRLRFCERRFNRVAASIAARKLSAGRRRPIAAKALVSALATGRLHERHRAHLCGFFEELPIESVHDVVLDEALDYARLLALARAVNAEGETVDWLAEMAGDRVA